ncbi:hypothetical protein J40TS1_43160 [Paenibacillus montaniterrae]|uniref:HTH cro/C1-type domain-containing protein n=1 Tax=Paenibacillus montaniterrae TaxID=429341 RepID=A0A919YUH6_9BACL|nr:helix-turn-helix transcriptional regulator [Paenibacillus montaniterrae]GIP18674.1 hypothetical protein J40TS1_43160 [Paenibacillus montaniterrae]
MSNLSKLIGKQLKLIRKHQGLTQQQVADHIANANDKEGFNKSRVSKIESGKENITLSTLELMMNALNVTPFELFNFQKYQNSTDFESKKLMIEAHRWLLMERPINEVKYIINTTNDFINTIEQKNNDSQS